MLAASELRNYIRGETRQSENYFIEYRIAPSASMRSAECEIVATIKTF